MPIVPLDTPEQRAAYGEIILELNKCPSVEDILSGKVTVLTTPMEVPLAYAVCSAAMYQLVSDKKRIQMEGLKWFQNRADNYIGFLLNTQQMELCIMFGRDMLTYHKLPFNMSLPHMADFSNKMRDLIME